MIANYLRSKMGCRVAVLLLIFLGLASCQTESLSGDAKFNVSPGSHTVFVSSNGWHSEIVIARASLPHAALPEAADFPDANYLGVAWGDAEYFPLPDPGFEDALAAALDPGPAVVHLIALERNPKFVFPKNEVVELELSEVSFAKLVTYLDMAVARESESAAATGRPGLYRFSRFYPANGEFHLFNTCNTWTARALAASGLPVRPAGTVTAEDLMRQVRDIDQ